MSRIVWGVGTPRTMRVHWMLHELGLDYETRQIITRTDAMDDPAFRVVSQGRSKIPFFEDGPLALGESAAIVRYLADRHRERSVLAPERGSDEAAHFDELCFFILAEIDAPLYTIRMHEGLPDLYGASPEACAAARAYFVRQAEHLAETRLADSPYLMGDRFNAADLLLTTCLDWARFAEIELDEALARYRKRVTSRPAYAAAFEANFTPAALAALGVSK